MDVINDAVTSPHKIQGKFSMVGGTALRPVYTGNVYRALVRLLMQFYVYIICTSQSQVCVRRSQQCD